MEEEKQDKKIVVSNLAKSRQNNLNDQLKQAQMNLAKTMLTTVKPNESKAIPQLTYSINLVEDKGMKRRKKLRDQSPKGEIAKMKQALHMG